MFAITPLTTFLLKSPDKCLRACISCCCSVPTPFKVPGLGTNFSWIWDPPPQIQEKFFPQEKFTYSARPTRLLPTVFRPKGEICMQRRSNSTIHQFTTNVPVRPYNGA